MEALLLEAPSRFALVDLPEPEPGVSEVLVEVKACGICGSDVHGYDGTSGRRTPPLVMGHEAAGVVVSAGAAADQWSQGDRVTFDSTLTCGACAACRQGRANLCEQREVVGAAFGAHRRDGAFAQRVVLPARALAALPDELPFERAAFAEPLAVALHAVRLAGDVEGRAVAVVGTGVIGLLAIQALRRAGAGSVVGLDLDPSRLELARALGASYTVDAAADDADVQVRAATAGGVDATIEAVGVAASIRTAVLCVRRGGRVVIVGNLAPTVELPLQAVVTGELELVGSCASSGEIHEAVELLASGVVDVERLTSAVAPLREGPQWFERLHAGAPEVLKVVLKP